jgi:hypothetical protein
LPACPCSAQEAESQKGQWVLSNTSIEYYHPGSASSYRSAESVNNHGQQCTYDREGLLITSGSATGTPDFWSPIGLSGISQHYLNDVRPFDVLGWQIYNSYWVPNNESDCPGNPVTPILLIPNSIPEAGPTHLAGAQPNDPYIQSIQVEGGEEPYNFRVTGGTLPFGLELDKQSGEISGTPKAQTENILFKFTITVTDKNNFTGSQTYSIGLVNP